MATLKIHNAPSRAVREKREHALERLLLLAVTLLPENSSGVQADLVSEAAFWLDFQPRGAKPHPTSPELRLGAREVQARADAYRLNEAGELVPTVAAVPVKGGKA